MSEETGKEMSELSTDHKNLFNSWNSLREYADGQITEINELKASLEAQLKERVDSCNTEASQYLPILKAIEQKKANVEAEMHDAEIPYPGMTLDTSDLTNAAENFLTNGTTEPLTVNYTQGEPAVNPPETNS